MVTLKSSLAVDFSITISFLIKRGKSEIFAGMNKILAVKISVQKNSLSEALP